MDLTYNYGTTNNNGNIQSLSYSGGGLSYTQSFSYDSLNRLSSATETTGSTTNWSQTNAYDRYGNRQIDYGGGSYNLSFSSSTNRITTSGYSYDSSGNLTNDGSHSYGFDGDSKIKSVDSTTAYTYDGEGKRIRKLVGENTRFIYGLGGSVIAEYDGSSGNLKKEYVAGGGSMITIEPTAVNSNGTQYATGDHLGSPRVITNSSGNVVSRHDYMPFGEDLGATVGGRTTGMGFSNSGDNNRRKFTGYERDTETGLDFAQARFYGSTQGRFTNPDPFSASAVIADPQTFNRYMYCRNNPVNSVDPSGTINHPPISIGSDGHISTAYSSPEADAIIAEDEAAYEARVKAAFRGVQDHTIVTVMITTDPAQGKSNSGEHNAADSASNPSIGYVDATEDSLGTASPTQARSSPWNLQLTMTIIWGPAPGTIISAFGHVSHITLQNDTSYSFEGPIEWTKDTPSSNFTNRRSKISAGVGYVFNFGPKLNAEFQAALLSFNDYGHGWKRTYGFYGNNCANPFNIAINAIRNDLGIVIPKSRSVYPQETRDYIEKYLVPSSYFVSRQQFPKQ